WQGTESARRARATGGATRPPAGHSAPSRCAASPGLARRGRAVRARAGSRDRSRRAAVAARRPSCDHPSTSKVALLRGLLAARARGVSAFERGSRGRASRECRARDQAAAAELPLAVEVVSLLVLSAGFAGLSAGAAPLSPSLLAAGLFDEEL